jgi:subtilisin-like proprotein convertase family protein
MTTGAAEKDHLLCCCFFVSSELLLWRACLKFRRPWFFFLFSILGVATLLLGQACSPKGSFKPYSDTGNETGSATSGPDSYFGYQWYLGGTSVSASLNIDTSSVWEAGNLGQGVRIAVVDPSSIYLAHSDLSDNKDLTKSFNFLMPTRGTDTTLTDGESHGTCVAGVIGARDQNGKGIRGVASRASISARTTSGISSDIFDALTYKASETDVSSNSYGPPDDVAELNQYYIHDDFKFGISQGLSSGRGGLGTVYVWAAGNGRQLSDRSNYDGFASNFGVMSVCAVDQQGVVSFFSEAGSNLWVCAPGEDIPATDYKGLNCGNTQGSWDDLPNAEYTKTFTGTSAAAPIVSGVSGLILKAAKDQNKNLGWRDVKMIIAESAGQSNSVSWQPTRIGFHDDYGFGVVNAAAAVALVSSWVPVGNAAVLTKTLGTGYLGPTSSGSLSDAGDYLAMNNFTVNNALTENGTTVFNSSISYIEFVTLEVKLSHTDPGDLEISVVRTPIAGGAAATSKITKPHSCRDSNLSATSCASKSNYVFEFGIANFLGESAEGTWELKIRDGRANGSVGSVSGWRLKFYGH